MAWSRADAPDFRRTFRTRHPPPAGAVRRAGLLGRQLRVGQIVRAMLGWALIVVVIRAAYAYRSELASVGGRILAAFAPGVPIAGRLVGEPTPPASSSSAAAPGNSRSARASTTCPLTMLVDTGAACHPHSGRCRGGGDRHPGSRLHGPDPDRQWIDPRCPDHHRTSGRVRLIERTCAPSAPPDTLGESLWDELSEDARRIFNQRRSPGPERLVVTDAPRPVAASSRRRGGVFLAISIRFRRSARSEDPYRVPWPEMRRARRRPRPSAVHKA